MGKKNSTAKVQERDSTNTVSSSSGSANTVAARGGLPAAHIILVFAAVSISLVSLAPSMKETVLSLFKSSNFMTAYMGDSILIGDSVTNLPFGDIDWTITQVPDYGDSRHTVSIFAVPERVAGRHIYLYKSNYTSNECFKLKDQTLAIGTRSYIYFLPKEYTKHSKKYKGRGAYFQYILEDCGKEANEKPMMSYQFQSRAYFSDYLDNEPGATKRAAGCKCQLTENVINKNCPQRSQKCIDELEKNFGCPLNVCSGNGYGFNATNSSYNFFAISAPSSPMKFTYSIDVEMFFYNVTNFGKHFVCTIRGTDTCSFQRPAYSKYNPYKKERYLVIAYVQPNAAPGFFTTQLHVEAKLNADYALNVAFLCGLVVFLIVKHCLQGIFGINKS